MAGNLFVLPRQTPLNEGAVSPGAKLRFFQTGTTTEQNTYQDIDLTTAHANPVIADANGEFAPIYFDPSLPNYRVRLLDPDDNQLYQVDDVPASQAGKNLSLEDTAPYVELVESDGSANNKVWRLQANGEQLLLRLGNDAKDTFANILTIDRTANTGDSLAFTVTAFSVSGSITANSNAVAERTSGSFTPTHTGFSSAPSGDIYWNKVGDIVYLRFAFAAGTSNGTTWTITNWPSAIQADNSLEIPLFGLVDNGTEITRAGSLALTNGSAIASFYSDLSNGLWTGSGNKGFVTNGVVASYSIEAAA